MDKSKKIGVISLGCDKNRVDTEKMLALVSKEHILTEDIDDAEIIIINTCAFLEDSRKEAISEILDCISLKENGLEKIIVTGCLPQYFIDDIFLELPEVDGFLGVSNYSDILSVIDRIYQGERVRLVDTPKEEDLIDRVLTTSKYAFLKIADGCDNHCTYCLIPKIRGRYRSRSVCDLIKETKKLGEVNELILVAQDVTAYGKDFSDGTNLVSLIHELSKLDNVKGIRLLYCYPENITDELISEFKTNPKMIKYIDIPLQHADDKILKLMNRRGTGKGYLQLIEKFRAEVPKISIRSTFITGFPNEDEQAFDNLVEFIKQAKLDNAGFFKYSREVGTASDRLSGHLPSAVKTKRLKKLYSVQKQIVKEKNKEHIGKIVSVVAEGFDDEKMVYFGRAYFNAPETDGKVMFFSDDEIVFGNFYDVKIVDYKDYDLIGERV